MTIAKARSQGARLVTRLLVSVTGATSSEYAILLVGVAVAIVAGVTLFGLELLGLFDNAAACVDKPADC